MKFADLATRTITAVILIGFVLFCEWISGHKDNVILGVSAKVIFPSVSCLFVILCSFEFVRLCPRLSGNSLFQVLYYLLSFGPSLYLLLNYQSILHLSEFEQAAKIVSLGVVSLFLGVFVISLSGKVSLDYVKIKAIEALSGSLLLGLGGASLVGLAMRSSHETLFWVVAIVAANDIGAYFIGKLFGRNKLSLFISPGKSVEGTFGGLVAGCLIALLLQANEITPHIGFAILVALFIGIAGQLFDILKSALKRIADVKDSGTLLPGHGGFLDRLDGILGGSLALQVMYVLLS